MFKIRHGILAALIATSTFYAPSALAADSEDTSGAKLCIPLPKVSIDGSTPAFTALSEQLRTQLSAVLSGPLVNIEPLTARLASQINAESMSADCEYVLTFNFDHRPKSQLGRQSADAALDLSQVASSAVDLGDTTSGALGAASALGGMFGVNKPSRGNGFYPVGKNDQISIQYTLKRIGSGSSSISNTVSGKATKNNEPLADTLLEVMAENLLGVISSN